MGKLQNCVKKLDCFVELNTMFLNFSEVTCLPEQNKTEHIFIWFTGHTIHDTYIVTTGERIVHKKTFHKTSVPTKNKNEVIIWER